MTVQTIMSLDAAATSAAASIIPDVALLHLHEGTKQISVAAHDGPALLKFVDQLREAILEGAAAHRARLTSGFYDLTPSDKVAAVGGLQPPAVELRSVAKLLREHATYQTRADHDPDQDSETGWDSGYAAGIREALLTLGLLDGPGEGE